MDLKKHIPLFVAGALILVGASFFFGTYWGYNERAQAEAIATFFGDETEVPEDVDFTLLLRAWKLIDQKYVFDDKPDSEARLWGAIKGLVESIGDPYSEFLPPQEAEIFSEDVSGSFGGLGMEIGLRDSVLTVIAPIKDTPAAKAGILASDKIIEIDGEPTANLSINEAVLKIRGPIGTSVTLTILRKNEKLEGGIETLEIKVTRAEIKIPTIETKVKGDVYIVSLYNFNANSTALFSQALSAFEGAHYKKLIIDLRGNPGGFLDAAIETASFFVPEGKVVVREYFGEGREEIEYGSKGHKLFSQQPRIVVLVDAGSASASEIFAAALQEHGIATIVGTKTFGKGSVQELVPFTDNTFLKITIAKWLTPKGKSISEAGVTPDVTVELTAQDFEEGKDPQLDTALSILK